MSLWEIGQQQVDNRDAKIKKFYWDVTEGVYDTIRRLMANTDSSLPVFESTFPTSKMEELRTRFHEHCGPEMDTVRFVRVIQLYADHHMASELIKLMSRYQDKLSELVNLLTTERLLLLNYREATDVKQLLDEYGQHMTTEIREQISIYYQLLCGEEFTTLPYPNVNESERAIMQTDHLPAFCTLMLRQLAFNNPVEVYLYMLIYQPKKISAFLQEQFSDFQPRLSDILKVRYRQTYIGKETLYFVTGWKAVDVDMTLRAQYNDDDYFQAARRLLHDTSDMMTNKIILSEMYRQYKKILEPRFEELIDGCPYTLAYFAFMVKCFGAHLINHARICAYSLSDVADSCRVIDGIPEYTLTTGQQYVVALSSEDCLSGNLTNLRLADSHITGTGSVILQPNRTYTFSEEKNTANYQYVITLIISETLAKQILGL